MSIMESSDIANMAPFMLDRRYYVNPAANEIGFLKGTALDPIIKIEPRLMEVLVCLAQGKGRVVKKEQLITDIWDNYGGAEDALLQSISKLRKLLGDNARKPRVIETIPKKGYRLLPGISEATHIPIQPADGTPHYTAPVVIQQVGLFTGFLERLTDWRFFLVFLVFSAVLLSVLGLVYQIVFWWSVS